MTLKIAQQVESMGERCGCNEYASRLNDALNSKSNVESHIFLNKPRKDYDVMAIHYEPGLFGDNPQKLPQLLQTSPLKGKSMIVHHSRQLQDFYSALDGCVLHHVNQLELLTQQGFETPWMYDLIPHPALYFERQDKADLRNKYNLPNDKKILGTAGFISGTGKRLPLLVKILLSNLGDDEFLYLTTAFWKSSRLSSDKESTIKQTVEEMGMEDNFRIDTEFVDPKTLNEKMQCCDLLFSWNTSTPETYGSQSGIAMDMMAASKTIVKNVPHYAAAKETENVEIGRSHPKKFAEDVLQLLRNDTKLNDLTPREEIVTWDDAADMYIEHFRNIKEMI